LVTPLAGVWIEISLDSKLMVKWWSRLSQACGLKFSKLHPLKQLALVTPLAGVWIEIPYGMRIAEHGRSRLSQACGLKYDFLEVLE